MKKTLAAVALMSAFAGSAMADVTLYGRVDTGLLMNDYEKTTEAGVVTEGTSWGLESGLSTTSRVGIRGSEQISEGLTVGFNLETKLLVDSGKAFDGGFDRESVLWAKTDYGTVYAGKVGSMWSDGGATNFWAGNYVAFGTGAGADMAAGSGFMVSQARVANRVAYKSPTIAGFTAYAEYSFGTGITDDHDKDQYTDDTTKYFDNQSKDNRPAALGLNYANGAFGAGMVVSYKNEASVDAVTGEVSEPEDEVTVSVGTNYDFGVANVKLAAQYYKDANTVGLLKEVGVDGRDEFEGYSVTFGADIPAWGGNWTVGLAYGDGEDKAEGANFEYEGYNAAAMYYYPLSKQTKVYAGAGYTKMESGEKAEYESIKAVMGMAHYF